VAGMVSVHACVCFRFRSLGFLFVDSVKLLVPERGRIGPVFPVYLICSPPSKF